MFAHVKYLCQHVVKVPPAMPGSPLGGIEAIVFTNYR